MENNDIKITKLREKEWKWLSKIKIDFNLKSVNEVIANLHKFINKLNLLKDLQIMVESEIKIKK